MQRWCADMALPLTPAAESLLEWSGEPPVRVRTIIGSVRVSGTQTPSTDSEVRRPLGSQEEELFNKIQSIICTLVLNKIFKWHLTLPPLHIDIFYKERNMLATSLPSQFKSFVAEFMERDFCLGFLQYFSPLVV